MPNALAYLALFMAIPLGTAMFFVLRPPVAVFVVYIGCVMFLPERTYLDLPGLPEIGKHQVAAIACIFGALLRGRRRLREARLFRGPDRWALLFMAGSIGTSLTNTDPLSYGPVQLPPLTLWEAFSVSFNDTLTVLAPFVLGRAFFNNTRDLRMALTGFVVAAAVYTPFMFIELWLSPQMHHWVYGFEQHDFIQSIRGGGYRPLVFMEHGLAASMLLVWGLLSALTLRAARKPILGVPTVAWTAYLGVFLVAVKSLGALMYGVTLGPMISFFRARSLVRVSLVLAFVVFSYPFTRTYDIFPDEWLVEVFTAASGDRAASLAYRFDMENMIAEHASLRPWFGWGRFGRNMVYAEWGKVLSVSDGLWVILYSARGIVGFVAFFTYLLSPLFLLRKRIARVPTREEQMMLAGLAVLLAICAVDLLPNGLFTNVPLFMAGMLYGATRTLSAQAPTTSPEAIPVVRRVV